MTTPPFETSCALSNSPGIRHGFFGRRGGVSSGLYDSLNSGEGSNDASDNIIANRARIRASLGAEHMLSCYQIHSADVVTVTTPWDHRPEADAMVSQVPGIALCILTADCTPVLFADHHAGIIGAAHAGWKGALGGVLETTIDQMVTLGADRANITAAIGPTIGQPSYEVGPEFRDTFLKGDTASANFFKSGAGDRFQFDLPGYVDTRLQRAGIMAPHNLARDTCALEFDYFSNRRHNQRGENDYGRNASVISIDA